MNNRKNIYLDEETRQRLAALTRSGVGAAGYASDSEAIRVAVERLFNMHFHPTSEAPDLVLNQTRQHIKLALMTIEGELARRAELEDLEDTEV